MTLFKRAASGVLGVLLLTIATGCGLGDPRTSNQGGGNLLTATSKLMDGDLKSLTADEWQILGDNIPTLATQYGIDLGDVQIPSLTDEQASAVVAFLIAFDLNTIEEVFAAVQSGAIGEDDIPPELRGLI